jgi:hypothetical protein
MAQLPIAFIINDFSPDDADEHGLEQHEHRVLEERPYLPKRKHSIITLQTTTVVRIPSINEPIHDEESEACDDEVSVVLCEGKCSSPPSEVLLGCLLVLIITLNYGLWRHLY